MAQISPYLQDIDKALRRLELMRLDGCRILITGAMGLIGGCLVDLLMRSGTDCKVYAFGRDEERARKRFESYWNCHNFHFIKGDVTVPLNSEVCFDYIIHAASNASPNFFKEKPVEVIKSNILGTQQLIEYGLSHNMKRMLYVSSGEIYGEGTGRAFVETDSGYVDCAIPRSCYPSSKRAAETLCVSYAAEYGADVVIARPCHTYGPYFTESDNRVYAQFIRNVLNGEDIVLKSSGDQFRSWIYVVDCVSAILMILLKGAGGQAYNVADENSNVTIRELAKIIARVGHRQLKFDIDIQSGNTTPISKAVFNIEKLRNLGWNSSFCIKEGLEHTIETLR
jgi:nucleoside-diphosphate-sugar epimerase